MTQQDTTTTTTNNMEEQLIQELETNSSIPDTGIFAKERGWDHTVLVDSVLKSLIGREIVEAKPISHEIYIVTKEGQEYAQQGSPEWRTFQATSPQGTPIQEIQSKLGIVGKLGVQQCLKRGWLKLEDKKLFPQVTQVVDDTAVSIFDRVLIYFLIHVTTDYLGKTPIVDAESTRRQLELARYKATPIQKVGSVKDHENFLYSERSSILSISRTSGD